MNKVELILSALSHRPHTNAELCEIADEIPSYLSRRMAKLRERGLVVNLSTPGRGHRAIYALAQERAA